MNALVPVSAPSLSFADIERMGTYIAKSRLFGLQTPEQAIALMLIAQAEGRHPAEAARDYDIIQNRPAKKAEAMLRDFLQGGGKVEWHTLDDTKAEATFSHPQGGKVRISWDLDRAQKAGLGGKPTWKAFPRQMLRSRCVSEGVRTVWPMATSGMYVPEETRDMEPPFDGKTIEAEAEQPEPPKPSEREAFNTAHPIAPAEPKRQTMREWLDEFRRDTEAAKTQDEATPILDRALAMHDFLATRPAALAQYDAIRNACIERLWAEPPSEADDELPPVEIRGEHNVMAG
jgi:hypothetical protein